MNDKINQIPISAAKVIAKKYGKNQVIIVTFQKGAGQTVTTYGASLVDCDQAAQGGNFVKKALGWPDELCHAEPSRVKNLLADNNRLEAENKRLRADAELALTSKTPGPDAPTEEGEDEWHH